MTMTTELRTRDPGVVVDALQGHLADLLDLTLKAKHAHWNVTGPNFRSVHLQLDEITDDLRVWSDTVAERIVTIGGWALGQAHTVAGTGIPALPDREAIPAAFVVGWFADRLAEATARARVAADAFAEADPVSQGIVLQVIEGLEKHTWMLRAQAA